MQTPLIIPFGSAQLKLREITLRMEQAVGGYLLTVWVSAEHDGLPNGVAVLFSGDVRLQGGARPMLGPLQQCDRDGPLVLRPFPVGVSFAVPLSYEALDAVERQRDGGDLELFLGVHALIVGPGVEAMEYPAGAGQVVVPVTVGDWVRELEQVDAGAGVYVVVRPPLHAATGRRADAVVHLREARRLLAEGRHGLAVAEARKVLDILSEIDPVPASADLPAKKGARDKIQRWAELRAAVTGLANAAPHADQVAADVTWTRQDALAVIATIAGLFQRLD